MLWVGIQAVQTKYPNCEIYVYTGDVEVTPIDIIARTNKNLNVKLAKDVNFVYLIRRKWIEPQMYSYFTLLGQSLGSVYLAFEALNQLVPDIFIDTTGCAFTMPVFKYLANCKTGCYVHYPTITSEMIRRVSNRYNMYNNRNIIARSPFFTAAKLFYYKIFALLYSLAGQTADTILVNSTFTQDHLVELWQRRIHLVFPPCDVDHLKELKGKPNAERVQILSLAQFRPEKDHALQLQAMYELREIVREELFAKTRLVLCGSCRNQDDIDRVKDLRDLSRHLSLENNVEFRVNVTYQELLDLFQSSHIGLHTMLDEHFGIGVVELMAAGLIVVAHQSGGPLLDIVETSEASRLGFLAKTSDEYARTIKHIMALDDSEVDDIRKRARASVDRFSTQKFQGEFIRAILPLFKP